MDQLPRLGKRELICLLSFTCNYVVFVWRGFLFLWVLGMGYVILLWHSLSLPYNYFRKWRDCNIYVEKTKALISCADTTQLICASTFASAKSRFSHYVGQIMYPNIVWTSFRCSIKSRFIYKIPTELLIRKTAITAILQETGQYSGYFLVYINTIIVSTFSQGDSQFV